MPANTRSKIFMSGKVHWAKVLSDPVPNFGGDAREWTFEFEPDEDGIKLLKQHKIADRLKDKENPDRKVLILRKSEFKKDGTPNDPIRVYDGDDEEWDRTTLIGNGSGADVKLDTVDYGVGKKKGVYPAALRINDLVRYQSSEFGAMDEGKEKAPKAPKLTTKKQQDAEFKKDFGLAEDDLDDEVPF